jgi:GNAT superfamily N-acetyltransferase
MKKLLESAREGVKKLLHVLFGDYQYWKVLTISPPVEPIALPAAVKVVPVDRVMLEAVQDPGVQNRLFHEGAASQGFGLYVGDELAAVLWFWWGNRYVDGRAGRSWPLPEGAAKLVGLYTLPEFRGRGYALMLQSAAISEMFHRGFSVIMCRVWHSHKSSLRVFEKGGWKVLGSYIELCPLGRRFRFCLPKILL